MFSNFLILLSLTGLIISKDCDSPTCVRDSELILSRINYTANPCDDFYEFACGNYWDSKFNLSTKFHEFSEVYMLYEKLSEEIVELFVTEKDEQEPLAMVRRFFKSCNDREAMKKRGITPLKRLIEEIGGWPVVLGELWDEEVSTWEDVLYEAFKRGLTVEFPFKFSTTRINSTNATHYREIYEIIQPTLPITNECYHQLNSCNSTYDLYEEHQIETAILFGAKRERAKKEMMEALEFEVLLSNLTHSDLIDVDASDENFWFSNMTVSQLKTNYSSINWEKVLSAVLPDHINLNDNETIVFETFSYLAAFNELIELTPKRTIVNFLIMRIVNQYLFTLTGEDESYLKQSSAWEQRCMSAILDDLPILVNSIYIRNYFNFELKDLVVEIVEGMKKEFMGILSTSKWMDESTKNEAIKKLESMKALVGFPDELLDDEILKMHHKNLTISENFFESVLSVSKFKKYNKFKNLHTEVNKTDWRLHSDVTQVNAFYLPLDNIIKIPAPFLQGDFIHLDRPKYLNLASLGFIIGHEMTHGFDAIGHQFNEIGNYVDWWHNETKKTFKSRFKCLVKEYNEFIDKASKLNGNGTATLNENIADNGGIKLSYRYFKSHLHANGEQLTLPNFNFSHNQLFWIVSAQVWCSVHDSAMGTSIIQEASHSLAQFRVNGPIKNMPEFGDDWKCEENSAMNPIEKCEVW